MTAQAKLDREPAITAERILFDNSKPQTFKFTLSQKGRAIPISHTVEPVSDARYFQMCEEIEAVARRLKKLDTAMYRPKEKIWEEFVNEATGYGDIPNWKDRVALDDRIGIVNAYFEVEPDEEPQAESSNEPLVYDFDALTPIYFSCRYGSARLMGMCHKFREITRVDKDEYLAIISNDTDETAIASAEKLSKNERLWRLGKKLLKETEGYDGDVPAWHLCATTDWYFLREQARQGK